MLFAKNIDGFVKLFVDKMASAKCWELVGGDGLICGKFPERYVDFSQIKVIPIFSSISLYKNFVPVQDSMLFVLYDTEHSRVMFQFICSDRTKSHGACDL
jgi:hypothetical protein